jgi:hypothetical protein
LEEKLTRSGSLSIDSSIGSAQPPGLLKQSFLSIHRSNYSPVIGGASERHQTQMFPEECESFGYTFDLIWDFDQL